MSFHTQIPSAFTAAVLALLGVVLLLFGRRKGYAWALATLLLLVASNFLAGTMVAFRGPDQAIFWSMVGVVSLSWDPFFLLLFVGLFPFRRPSVMWRVSQWTSGITASLATLLVAFDLDGMVRQWQDLDSFPPFRKLLLLHLIAAYTVAWLLAIANARDAPTQMLRERASWAILAIGVVAVARMVQVGAEMGADRLACLGAEACPMTELGAYLFQIGFSAALMAAVYLGGVWLLGDGSEYPAARRSVSIVGWISLGYLAASLATVILQTTAGWGFAQYKLYGIRWFVFSGVLLYGVLAYEFLGTDAKRVQIVTYAVGLLGAFGAFVTLLAILVEAGHTTAALPEASLAALAAGIPMAVVAKGRASTIAASPGNLGMHLYRGAVEGAMTSGLSGHRLKAELSRYRQRFRIGAEAARTVEELVRADLDVQAWKPEVGDEVLPGIVLRKRLGRGDVFLASSTEHGDVVVKVYSGCVEGRRRGTNEIQALKAMARARIAHLLDFKVRRGRVLAVIEYLPGQDLASVLRRKRLDEKEVRQIAADILTTLEEAHDRGLIHLDIKPSNIILREGQAWLTDFDAAVFDQRFDPEQTQRVDAGGVFASLGTLSYMAPEQIHGEAVTPATDLYSLGMVLHECFTGRRPALLEGLADAAAVQRVVKPGIDLRAVPEEWRDVLRRALETSVEQRFASAAQMQETLPEPDSR